MTALVSRASLLLYTNVQDSDSSQDTILEALAGAVTELAENWCGRTFEQEERVEYHRSYLQWRNDPEPQYIWVDKPPIDLDAGVIIVYAGARTWDDPSNSATLIETQDYLIDSGRGMIEVFGDSLTGSTNTATVLPGATTPIFREARAGFRVTYTGGYKKKADPDGAWAFLDVPAALTSAAGMWASLLFITSAKGGIGLETLNGDKPEARKALMAKVESPPPEIQVLLKSYRRRDGQLRFVG